MLARQETPKSAVPAEWMQPITRFRRTVGSKRNNRAPVAPAAAPG